MTLQTSILCPHCGASNLDAGAFCQSCGKALPSAIPGGPRIVSADALPTSAVGQRLVSDELVKTQKRASTALLVVAILTTVGAAIVFAITGAARQHLSADLARALQIAVLIQSLVCVLFWGLWFWSRKAPLPAAIVGLVIYATLIAINVISAMSQLAANPNGPKRGFGGIGVGILDIIILILLVRGIQAGLKHKRLQQQMQAA